ncbi:hypothetical protein SKAU_G00305590 [Synaphobranchus kaupii]|uniref:Uncharacterized protein n=1 Tax=Synaphobranchus kaupii TaxID=118154 RepID=A0A9Q1EQQ5_SYNKA|nr:hypothetical protein SKAU_G00305590 [Synaphobranchus kaupii]
MHKTILHADREGRRGSFCKNYHSRSSKADPGLVQPSGEASAAASFDDAALSLEPLQNQQAAGPGRVTEASCRRPAGTLEKQPASPADAQMGLGHFVGAPDITHNACILLGRMSRVPRAQKHRAHWTRKRAFKSTYHKAGVQHCLSPKKDGELLTSLALFCPICG